MRYLYTIALLFLSSQAFSRGSLECANAERLSKTSAVELPGFQTAITITVLFKVTSDPGAVTDLIIEMANTAITSQLGLSFRGGGATSRFGAVKSGGTPVIFWEPAPSEFYNNKWTFIAFTYDGTTNRMYVKNISTDAYSQTTVTHDAGQFNTLFVCDDTFSAFFTGKVADIHISSGAYTEEEVMEAYQCSDFKHRNEVLHLPLNDGTSKANPSVWYDLNERRNNVSRVAGTPRIDWDGPPLNYCYSSGPQ